MSALAEVFYIVSAVIWLSLTVIAVPVIGGFLAKAVWEFFTSKSEDSDAWPFPKEFMALYHWGGTFNYDIGTIYRLNGKPRGEDLVTLDHVSWVKMYRDDGTSYWRINMEFNTRRLDEVTMQVFDETKADTSEFDLKYKKAMERAAKSIAHAAKLQSLPPEVFRAIDPEIYESKDGEV